MPDTSKPLSLEFFINPRCPPGSIPAKAAISDVRLSEAMIMPEREAPAAVLGTYISEAGKHLLIAEVELGNEPDFFV